MLKPAHFLIASAGLVYISRDSLRVHAPRTHGFYRFFAWEAILGLFLLNVDFWFVDPFAPHQLIAWMLLIVSAMPVIVAVRLLREIGKPDRARQDDSATIGIEKTTTLVEVGRVQVHSSSTLQFAFVSDVGYLFQSAVATRWIASLLASLLLVATAKAEERETIRFFGPAYQTYIE